MNKESYNKPNLFLLGAAKSGTTTLYNYLTNHPDIFFSSVKEPNTLCSNYSTINSIHQYLELYNDATHALYRGDASHAYLTDPTSAKVIASLFSESKFIVILRNPAERAFSLFHHMLRNGYELERNFERALRKEEKLINSTSRIPIRKENFYNYCYFHSGKYGEQISRYLDYIEREKFLFLKFEDMIADPSKVLLQVSDFLSVRNIPMESIHSNQGTYSQFTLPELIHLKRIYNKHLPKARFQVGINKFFASYFKNNSAEMSKSTYATLMMRYQEDLITLKEKTGIEF